MAPLHHLFSALCLAILFAGTANAAVQGVFAHYMARGMSSLDQALADVTEAQALGLDAFALNVQHPDAQWTLDSHLPRRLPRHPAHWPAFLASLPVPVYFIPNFDDHPSLQESPALAPDSPLLTSTSTSAAYLDGLMGWETAWPQPGTPLLPSTAHADALTLAAARAASKTYMFPVSAFQSKHHRSWGNWLRRGGLTLARRMEDALLLQPDFVQLLSWNDAGEGHYLGNVWPEAVGREEWEALVDGWGHKGWQAVLRPWIRALKVWVDRLGLGKPTGWEEVEDAVNVVAVLGSGQAEARIRVWSGGVVRAEFEGKIGMNVHQVAVEKGEQVVQLVAADGRVIGEGRGSKGITDRIEDIGGICNYNYQVVEIV
ncbi:hypothetical protein NEMBOFW57_009430 [Staphylotrichum longicolle]|uniref:Uncharacterized protein n=1 Tax=Staphylotrichum longicolle TaxID=669026 RepID=A0AAD4EPE9_9PEZI|nr:hypothetical protein NEMBOFW57_009430 [Staphylotrichum longicolle]